MKGGKLMHHSAMSSPLPYSLGNIAPSKEVWDALKEAPTPTAEELLQLPSSFDEREASGGEGSCKAHKIQDQGSCGSCWAFAASRVYDSRLCRKSKGRWNIAIAEQDVLSCYESGSFYLKSSDGAKQITKQAGTWTRRDGCNGGNTISAWLAMTKPDGKRVSRWADAYTGNGHSKDACGSVNSASIKFGVSKDSSGHAEIYKINPGATSTIMHAIYSGGAVAASFDVYSDIMKYRGGIYSRSSNSKSGGHAVAVVGWGTEGGTKYWTMANSWGSSWGEKGYGRIISGDSDKNCGFEEGMTYPVPALPTACAGKSSCRNGGEFDSSCKCRCDGSWTGEDCGTCAAMCKNGGTKDAAACSCSCPSGYFGAECEQYVLIRWKAISGATGTINAAWSLGHSHSGSHFVRKADAQGTSGGRISISGSSISISGASGSKDFEVNLGSYVPGYPRGWFYVFQNSLGTNEFGASRGYQTIDLPSLHYESSDSCVKGGHKPTAPGLNTCAGAYPSGPSPVATPTTRVPTRAQAPPMKNPDPTQVKTKEGPACVFPFDFKGKTYNECTTEGHSSLWCYTAKDKSTWGHCLTSSPAPPSSPSTRAPTRAPSQAPTKPASPPSSSIYCVDQSPTGFTINGADASCSRLSSYCTHSTYGAAIRQKCPKTCGTCSGSSSESACADSQKPPFTLNGSPAKCPELLKFCSQNSRVRSSCPKTCGAC
jgi:cathepsin B